MEIEALKSRWRRLFQSTADIAYIDNGFDNLAGRYLESHRHYHNLNHVSGCLDAFDLVADHVFDKFCIETAIWFHDVVYNPKSTQNEAMSADYACSFLSSTNIEQKTIFEIDRLIRLTRHPSNPITDDEKYLIDIDLATLGAERAQYDHYEEMIRKEYAYVPGVLYKKGRKKILNAFLDCEKIYRTRYFNELLEAEARANIERVLKYL